MRRLLDAVGWPERAALTLLTLWVAWSWAAALFAGRVPLLTSPYVLSPVLLVVGVVLGRIVATRLPPDVIVAGLVIVTTVLLVGVIWTDGPAKRPTAYANANAALAVQVIGLAGLAMLGMDRAPQSGPVAHHRRGPRRHRGQLLQGGLRGGPAAARRDRPDVVATGPPSVVGRADRSGVDRRGGGSPWSTWRGSSSGRPRSPGRWTPLVRSCGATRSPCGSPTRSPEAGPGRWRSTAPWAATPTRPPRTPRCSRWAPRPGWVGVILFALVVLAGLWWAARGSAPWAVVAAAAWTALLVHSLTDHLLEFGPVVLAAGVAVGWAGASRPDGGEASRADDHTGVTSTSG